MRKLIVTADHVNPNESWIEMAQRLAEEVGAPIPDDEEADFLLWERTAFPLAPAEYVAQQLVDLFVEVC